MAHPRKLEVFSPDAPSEDELLTLEELAALLKVAPATVQRMRAAGKLPEPIRVGPRLLRFRRDEVRAWIRLGCPKREAWTALRKQFGF